MGKNIALTETEYRNESKKVICEILDELGKNSDGHYENLEVSINDDGIYFQFDWNFGEKLNNLVAYLNYEALSLTSLQRHKKSIMFTLAEKLKEYVIEHFEEN